MNGISLRDIQLFLPDILVALSVIVVCLGDVVLGDSKSKRKTLCGLSMAMLAAAAIALVGLDLDAPTSAFYGMVAVDPLGIMFKGVFLAIAGVSVLTGYLSKELPTKTIGEYYILLLAITFGLFLMASPNDLLMLYLGVELVSIVSFAMAGFRLNDRRSSEAAMKYVIYGGAASGILLFGLSLMYGLFGTTELTSIHHALNSWSTARFHDSIAANTQAFPLTVILSITMILAGIGYKVAVVPFHMWSPDVYEGAPTPFTGFLSVGPKAAGFALLMRFLITVFVPAGEAGFASDEAGVLMMSANLPIAGVLGIMAALTMTFGNLAAIPQTNVKRLLAYSSIAHAGYLLMGFVVLSKDSLQAVVLYLVIYYLMNLGAFTVCQAVRDRTGEETLDAFKGLGTKEPALAVFMMVFLLSLTGLPPLAGFVGKFYLFAAVIKHGGFWFLILAIIGVVNSAISLFYYFKIARSMYLDQNDDETPLNAHPAYVAITGALAVATLVLGIYWAPLSGSIRDSLSLYRSGDQPTPVAQIAPATESEQTHR